ncbi:putative calcium/calmodulin dependent protein kinase [Aspergillus homomorphus CBS 101889]|uniref:Calcium/calmodulin-dependent protein kinase n=1 Tax=Aspergillus homomorphus (strain CBS 101889) TaxID=1450537 RepID=A0A395HV36_ASPHC|nr:calcium/calmodulin-dependent protein kinase [Aspergillus homomorphus CBS 101889]RAL10094.1 calcium/calmodulin-dependent protein kinase [Aspergillus homomorphus CBS 101889]
MDHETTELIQRDVAPSDRPPLSQPWPFRSASTPVYGSPQRHHRRNPIVRRPVKETLDARSEYTTSQDDGTAEHRINQYVIKQEIGRGSFGAVHLAVDQFGNEYVIGQAVKEFSKARLRRRAQSHLLRRPRGPKRLSDGFNSPLHRHSAGVDDHKENALYLIKEEIAIMKKLNHNNLVSLIEVLDDPTEDSLYMVMEMCKKGVVMKVSLEERADPYEDALCRCWFRDLILGIEYLHAQGIVHRDIKPDNCLVTNDDVIKIVDFGVSEMFEKDSNMYTAKSAGSPAFLPPELCVVKHGDVSGKAADIWSMGVTLYCLRYGKLPFEKQSIFELYEAIKNDAVVCEGETDDNFRDLISRILEKDPAKRIQMHELREHPWVTQGGLDPLLPESENTAEIVDLPTEEEMNSAITKTIGHVMAVIKAVKHFKRLIDPAKADPPMQSILGQEYETHFVEPPMEMEPEESFSTGHMGTNNKAQSLNSYNKAAWEQSYALKGYQRRPEELSHCQSSDTGGLASTHVPTTSSFDRINTRSEPERKESGSIHSITVGGGSIDDVQHTSTPQSPSPLIPLSRASSATTKRSAEGTRGHARDPLDEEFPFLFIGPSTYTGSPSDEERDGGAVGSISEGPGNMVTEEPVGMDTNMETDMDANTAYPIVSESPGAAEFDIYETAYRHEIERIRAQSLPRQGSEPKVYLTRRVEGKDDVMKLVGENATKLGPMFGAKRTSGSGLASAVSAIRLQLEQQGKLKSATVPTSATTTGVTATEALHPGRSSSHLRDILDRVRKSSEP